MPKEMKSEGPEHTRVECPCALDKCYPFLLYWAPPVVWAGLIFLLSSQPGEAFPEITFVPNADKAVHVLEYAVLALLFARALFQYMWRTHRAPASIVCLIACLAFAVLDEFHQVSVPNRSFEWGDLGANAVGVGVGLLVYVFIQLKIAKRKTASPEQT